MVLAGAVGIDRVDVFVLYSQAGIVRGLSTLFDVIAYEAHEIVVNVNYFMRLAVVSSA